MEGAIHFVGLLYNETSMSRDGKKNGNTAMICKTMHLKMNASNVTLVFCHVLYNLPKNPLRGAPIICPIIISNLLKIELFLEFS